MTRLALTPQGALLFLCAGLLPAQVELHIAPDATNSFDPRTALGAGLDGHEQGTIAATLTPDNLARMRGAGLKALTYRLRTELAGEAWHWTTQGSWSDASHSQGYWTGDANPQTIADQTTYGYRLPRRGNTIDQANNDGYSRLVDGDLSTFWKSNPYLGDRRQWVVADLGRTVRIDAVHIAWGHPRALSYDVEYWPKEEIDITSDEHWVPLPTQGARHVRWLRIVLKKSDGSAEIAGSSLDWRDRTGFAIRELSAGANDGAGHFTDVLRHGTARGKQTTIWVSSTDPWHRAQDRDPDIEQPGFSLVFESGMSNHQPVLMPAPVLYDTPENTAALFTYLASKSFPVTDVELGEEPEEQYVSPEDFGELSRKTIAAIVSRGLHVNFGGPSLILLKRDFGEDAAWIARLYRYFQSVGSANAFRFFSFEWYPFDDICASVPKQLAQAAGLLKGALDKIVAAGIPKSMPWYMTEYGFSAFGTQAEVDLPGALFNAEAAALFLTWGGRRAYLYGYEPGDLLHDRPCTWGNNMLFYQNQSTATYWAARLLTQVWTDPQGGVHETHPVTTASPLITAYAVHRPDGSWAVLILNKSPTREVSVTSPFAGKVTVTQFSANEYAWQAAGEQGHILRSQPPASVRSDNGEISLPPYSLTVLNTRAN